jgi:hypothetical protein
MMSVNNPNKPPRLAMSRRPSPYSTDRSPQLRARLRFGLRSSSGAAALRIPPGPGPDLEEQRPRTCAKTR